MWAEGVGSWPGAAAAELVAPSGLLLSASVSRRVKWGSRTGRSGVGSACIPSPPAEAGTGGHPLQTARCPPQATPGERRTPWRRWRLPFATEVAAELFREPLWWGFPFGSGWAWRLGPGKSQAAGAGPSPFTRPGTQATLNPSRAEPPQAAQEPLCKVPALALPPPPPFLPPWATGGCAQQVAVSGPGGSREPGLTGHSTLAITGPVPSAELGLCHHAGEPGGHTE